MKGELEFPEPGTIEARCTIVESGSAVTVPLTALPPDQSMIDVLNPGPGAAPKPGGMDLVNRYAAALSLHPTPVEAVGEVAGRDHRAVRRRAPRPRSSASRRRTTCGAFEDVAGGLRKLLEPEVMIGCTAVGGRGRRPSRSRTGPGCRCSRRASARAASTASRSTSSETDDGFAIVGWPDERARRAARCSMLADPFSFPVARLPRACATRGCPDADGRSAGWRRPATRPGGEPARARRPGPAPAARSRVMCSDDVPVRAVVSQGCRPIGKPLTVTRAERNLVLRARGPARDGSGCRSSCRPRATTTAS